MGTGWRKRSRRKAWELEMGRPMGTEEPREEASVMRWQVEKRVFSVGP
jgi:hypothetical protein